MLQQVTHLTDKLILEVAPKAQVIYNVYLVDPLFP